jgi:hypothetical protein
MVGGRVMGDGLRLEFGEYLIGREGHPGDL